MTKASDMIVEGMTEAVAIAKGNQPAARLWINGFAYVPERQATALLQRLYALLQNDDQTGAAAYLPAGGIECERLVDEALDILRRALEADRLGGVELESAPPHQFTAEE